MFDLLQAIFASLHWTLPDLSALPVEALLVTLILSATGAVILSFFVPHPTWFNGILHFLALFAAGITAIFFYDAAGFRGFDSVAMASIVANAGMILCGLLIIFLSRRAT